jgi:hypothetical protein
MKVEQSEHIRRTGCYLHGFATRVIILNASNKCSNLAS